MISVIRYVERPRLRTDWTPLGFNEIPYGHPLEDLLHKNLYTFSLLWGFNEISI